MKINTKIRLRKTIQLSAFTLFIITVLQANYPFNPWIPPELFLWLDPLSGIITMIATRSWISWFLLSLIVLLSPLLAGRSFCGWVCPMGTLVDATDHVIAPKRDRTGRRFRHWKTFLLVFFLITAILGSQLAWFLDPMPLIWRAFGAVIFPLVTLLTNLILDAIIFLRLDSNAVFSVYDFISLHFLPLNTVTIQGAFGIGVVFFLILGLSYFSRRFWCRNLCPLGALLGILSKISPLQRFVDEESCTECAVCHEGCKMNAIEEDYYTTEKSECIFCLNCAVTCDFDSITFPLAHPTNMKSPVDLNRRQFVTSLVAGVTSTSLLRIVYEPQLRADSIIRPPGAVPEEIFLDKCIRCNECIRICSTTGKCLQPIHFESGLEGFWTPWADFRIGYCEYECNLCGQICPTQAIQDLPLNTKKKRKMGLAILDKDRCIPFRENENCIVCEEHCPTPEKAIVFDEKEVFSSDLTGTKTILYPVVKADLCIGCGICEEKCPIEGLPGIYVTYEGEERWLETQ